MSLDEISRIAMERSDRITKSHAEGIAKVAARQAHLDEGTSARAYWHMGYAAALRDIGGMIARSCASATPAHALSE